MSDTAVDRIQQRLQVAISWCLSYTPEVPRELQIAQIRDRFYKDLPCTSEHQKAIVDAVQFLMGAEFSPPKNIRELEALIEANPQLWNRSIGMVYGGATKIKQYVFEATKLQEIRGGSALLDNINLVDLPALFHGEQDQDYFPACEQASDYCQKIRNTWLASDPQFAGLADALIPELIVYSTGGNILAFCPSAVVNQLANAIEKRYTTETLTANSCAVGGTFKPLEIRLGLLPERISETTFWVETFLEVSQDSRTQAFISGFIPTKENSTREELQEAFFNRKSFNELASRLAILFNQRRSGNVTAGRPSRQFPVMFETHPYLRRDSGDKRSAIAQATELPNQPWLSEATARKNLVGRIAKNEEANQWYQDLGMRWEPNSSIETWVEKYKRFLEVEDREREEKYFRPLSSGERKKVKEAQSVREIGNACRGFVAYIYADGNNMGGFIRTITTPHEYQKFSHDIFNATEKSVYKALADNLCPHKLEGLSDPENENREGQWIHPFEIITIGGDDVMLIVPADKALAIAKTLGDEFEKHLAAIREYQISDESDRTKIHRYNPESAALATSSLSMSTGILITAETTPIYYAEDLTTQLLKSAKEKAKILQKGGHHGGTVDFLVLKSVTMISSNIREFRQEGLVKTVGTQKLKFYAAPYTLHELGGLINVLTVLKIAEFPKSQLYQIRGLLERGKRTAILNYRYFRVRLKQESQNPLQEAFENGWCKAKSNGGSVAPWMSFQDVETVSGYETIWRDLVDLYDFVPTTTAAAAQIAP
jgi:CRISPR-associated protein Cmr2